MKHSATHRRHRHDGCPFDPRADTIYSDEATTLVQRLSAVGMDKGSAILLIDIYGVQYIKRHLDELPDWLHAAIMEDWAAAAPGRKGERRGGAHE